MYHDYSPIILLIFLAIALIALPLVIQRFISPTDNKGGEKLIPYECGEIPEGSAWVKFNIRFYTNTFRQNSFLKFSKIFISHM